MKPKASPALTKVIATLREDPSITSAMLPTLGMTMDQWLRYAQMPDAVAKDTVRKLVTILEAHFDVPKTL